MAGFKGKELIRRLAWLVWQDQDNYRHQLEVAVSMTFKTFTRRAVLPENVLENVFLRSIPAPSRARSRTVVYFIGFQ